MTKRQTRPDRTGFDPASQMSETQRMIEEARQRQADTQPTAGRGKPAHAGRLGRDQRGRAKLTADVSLDVQTALRALAEEEEVAVSDIIEVACRHFLDAQAAGLVDLHPFKRPARSLRYVWKLDIPAEKNFFDK